MASGTINTTSLGQTTLQFRPQRDLCIRSILYLEGYLVRDIIRSSGGPTIDAIHARQSILLTLSDSFCVELNLDLFLPC